MIPAEVNIEDLASQLQEDGVAIGEVARDYPSMEGELQGVLADADTAGFGSVGMVLLDRAPAQTADQRDIASELINATGLDTVIVRSPGSGAIVSEVHTRADIEAAQWHFLGDSDYVGATRNLVDQITATPGPNWVLASSLAIILILAVVVLTWLGLSGRKGLISVSGS
ncbi:Rv1476 family membrane protein [Corynebacterium sp. A21]|uniref:Rv1476 family membrane protein n=1 Tax=Corynebacterium sp. A21 TaxID=3457318 RepID=UPI003FCF67CB